MYNYFCPYFAPTGIGSLPHLNPNQAVEEITTRFEEIPYWPQLTNRILLEQMNFQYIRTLWPLFITDPYKKKNIPHPKLSREEALTIFYKRFFITPLNKIMPSYKEALGFSTLIEQSQQIISKKKYFPWIKGHVIGPLTLAATIKNSNNKSFLFDEEILEAIAKGLGKAAAAQINQLSSLSRIVIIFFDEPILSSYGSSFFPISRNKIINIFKICLKESRKKTNALLGVHCCGNTDWELLIECDFNIISLDSVNYGEHLLLYRDALLHFYSKGGVIAWGAIPTSLYTKTITAQNLWIKLNHLLKKLEQMNFNRKLLAAQALITPSCGLSALKPHEATTILEMTSQVSELARQNYL